MYRQPICRRPATRRLARLMPAALGLVLPLTIQAKPLTFDWPVPATARVVVEENRRDREVTTEMRLRVTRAAEGQGWRLDFEDVRLIEINGNDVTSPEEQAHLPAPFWVVNETVPSFVVDAEGRIVEILPVEQQLDAKIAQIPERPPEVTHEALRMALFEPNIAEVLRAKVDSYWHLWVGLWLDKALKPGERTEFDAESDYFGVTVPSRGSFEHLGAAEAEQPGAARLAFQLNAEGEPLRQAIYESIVKAYEQADQPIPEEISLEMIESAKRRERVDVLTDPETMRPYEVRAVTSLELDMGEQGPQVRIEEKVFRFDWAAAAD